MENHAKCIFSHISSLQGMLVMLNTLCTVEDHENHMRWIYLTTVLNMGECRNYARINIYLAISIPNRNITLHYININMEIVQTSVA